MRIKSVITILIITIVLFGLLFSRLLYLQRYQVRYFRKNSEKQRITTIVERPQRGVILDRGGRILAASNKIASVFVDPAIIGGIERSKEIASQLQEILDVPGHKICELISKSQNLRYVRIKNAITDLEHEKIRALGQLGVGVQLDWKRFYPMGYSTSHVVGFVGIDQNGLGGIELKYESQLSGTSGKNVLLVDGGRRPIGITSQTFEVEDGLEAILTIDTIIQQFVRTILEKQMQKFQAESAVAIVMEPHTGAVLAMVSLPGFNPENFSTCSSNVLKNRVLTDPFEPGSIFKPIVASLALDGGHISFDEKIFCENGYYSKYRIGEWAGHKFGDLTVREILVESSNIGMAKIGQKMGKNKLYEGIKLFGFGSKTGIDLPGEEPGLLRSTDKWSGYSVTRIPYGHEVSATAIQIIRAYAALANDGKLVVPHVLKAVVDREGKATSFHKSSVPGYIIKPEIAQWITQNALVGVVNEGTGKQAALKKWQVFGKTGTANIARSDRKGYDEDSYTASFVGGAPANNSAVVVIVSIRKPNKALGKGYSGGRVAAPAVGEILEKTLRYLKVN